MTKAEMNRRLATLTEEQIAEIRRMIREGYGGRGIFLEGPGATLAQVNAVFELVGREAEMNRRKAPFSSSTN